jgi:cation transport ATPase
VAWLDNLDKDGINDASALVSANVGIAICTGSNAALVGNKYSLVKET